MIQKVLVKISSFFIVFKKLINNSIKLVFIKLFGQEVASKTFEIKKNIGGNTANSFSSGRGQTFEFDIPTTGNYVFSIYTDAKQNADFVLGTAKLQAKSYSESGIMEITNDKQLLGKKGCYDLSGRKIDNNQLPSGLYIVDGRKVMIK